MNFYERHLGDYAKEAGHLSLLEHGAYTLLMDRYYSTEQGIPADQAHRLARARSNDERAAVDAVLGEFFQLQNGVYINARAQAAISAYQEKEPERESKRENEKERQRRHRQRRATLFEQLREAGVVPVYDTSTSDLQKMYDRVTSRPVTPPVTRDTTATQSPVPSTSVAIATGDGAPSVQKSDPIWGSGLAFLIRKGIPERPARSLLGKLKQQCGDVNAGAILAKAEAEDITDPAPWLMAAATSAKNGANNGSRGNSAADRVRQNIERQHEPDNGEAAIDASDGSVVASYG